VISITPWLLYPGTHSIRGWLDPQQGQYGALFQAFTAKWMRSSLFFDITQRIAIIPCRRFGTTFRSYLLTLEDGTDRLSRNVGMKLLLYAA